MIRRAATLLLLLFASSALAHDYWGNGREVDRTTKSLCCGKNDCKEVDPKLMHVDKDGVVRFDDVPYTTLASKIMPSPDGNIWRCIWGDSIKCLFVPPDGS